jgi:hypothetical protein
MLDSSPKGHTPMSLYYLHIVDDDDVVLDPDGSDHPNLEAARDEAIDGARQLISDAVRHGSPLRMHRFFRINDADGKTLLNVPFTDAINAGDHL